MGKVRVLPQVLAHQIAAGEIVERPASVVKELVENSLDAEARRIEIEVEEGGKRLIRVTDDGLGMSSEDARLAFEHHATSKISEIDDLHDIRTLGFRGEALPSIASVSRTLLRTVDGEALAEAQPVPGTEVVYEGGEEKRVQEISWPRGTEISVENLFYNVPARRKFLKTVATEISHISRMVMCYALAYPQVSFLLRHGKRTLLDARAVRRLGERVYEVLGKELMENLVPLEYERQGITVSGFASLPHEQRNNSQALYLFVNRRMVRDRMLAHAIRSAYRDLIPSQSYPVVVLFVETDPRQIDVNVHPTKVEIRFRQSQEVHSAIFHAIEEALVRNKDDLSELARDVSFSDPQVGERASRIRSGVEAFLQKTQKGTFFQRTASQNRLSEDPRPSSFRPSGRELDYETEESDDDPIHGPAVPKTDHLSSEPVIMGQFVESFLVAVDREGVMLIDQHVAHERILYERSLTRLSAPQRVSVQQLLVPETIDLDPQQQATADLILEHLNQNGFEVDWFGEKSLIVHGVPAFAHKIDPHSVIDQLFDELDRSGDLEESPVGETVQRVREKIAISLSCRGAIKINTPLSVEKMTWLVDELFQCQNPYTCPHGRPIVLRLNLEEILSGFKRI